MEAKNNRITGRDLRFMAIARKIAISTDPVARAKVAALLVIKNQLVSVGQCQLRTHPFQAKFNSHPSAIFLHAETNAIHDALNQLHSYDLKKATLYIFRVKKDKSEQYWVDGLALPCKGCMSAIVTYGVKKIVYSTDTENEFMSMQR